MLHEWAARWNIHPAAMADLGRVLGMKEVAGEGAAGVSDENAVSRGLRLAASKRGDILWRNNVGALLDARGVPVRYGLCNDTAALNKAMKSADLVGIKRLEITQAHVGQVVGQFMSIEAKEPTWRYTGTKHEIAQQAWALRVRTMGGVAVFARSATELP